MAAPHNTVRELRDTLRTYGLRTTGTKLELIARLKFFEEEHKSQKEETPENTTSKKRPRSNKEECKSSESDEEIEVPPKRMKKANEIGFHRDFKPISLQRATNELGLKLAPNEQLPPCYDFSAKFSGQAFFPALPTPTHEDDWLAQYPEESESVPFYLKSRHRALLQLRRNLKMKVYLVAVGSLNLPK